MGFRSVVEEHGANLTAADERLVAELLSDPTEAAFMSAAEVAARAGLHEATAVRLAKKLGFSGYPGMRIALQDDVRTKVEPAERMRRRLAVAGEQPILQSLIDDEVAALRDVPRYVEQENLEAAARTLINARRVFLFAHGHATALVELVDRRMRRSGFATVRLTFTGRDLAEHVVSLDAPDAVLALAFRARPPGLEPLLEHCAKLGAPTILISDALGPMVRPRPNLLLAAPRGSEDTFQSLTTPMAIVNALVLTVAQLDSGRSIDSLKRLSDLLDAFEADEGGRRR